MVKALGMAIRELLTMYFVFHSYLDTGRHLSWHPCHGRLFSRLNKPSCSHIPSVKFYVDHFSYAAPSSECILNHQFFNQDVVPY